MRTCVLIACIATLVVMVHGLSEEDRTKVKNVHKECQANPTTHIDDEILKKHHKGEKIDKAVVGPHILCMSTKLGLIDDKGKVNKSNLKKALSRGISDEAKLNEVTEKCAQEKDDAQETAMSLLKCFRDNTDQSEHGDHDH